MTLQSQSIRELDFERSAANPSDWMILQDFENGQTYRIRRSDFLAGTQTSFLWLAATTYSANAIVEWGGTFWRSLQAGNVNRVPGEGAWWTEVEQADESAVKLFEANKIYKSDIVVVLHNNQLYRLTNATRPYQAATFVTADWQVITPAWSPATGAVLTGPNTISGPFNIGFTNNGVGFGVAAGSVPTDTRVFIKAAGSAGLTLPLRIVSSLDQNLFYIADSGDAAFAKAGIEFQTAGSILVTGSYLGRDQPTGVRNQAHPICIGTGGGLGGNQNFLNSTIIRPGGELTSGTSNNMTGALGDSNNLLVTANLLPNNSNRLSQIRIDPTINVAGGSPTLIGVDYQPAITALGTAIHLASRWASGSHVFGGTSLTHASLIVDIQSTTQAFAPPRMTSTQRDAIASPATGATLFVDDSPLHEGFHIFDLHWRKCVTKNQILSVTSKNITQSVLDNTEIPNSVVVTVEAEVQFIQTSGTVGSSAIYYRIQRTFRKTSAGTLAAVAATTTLAFANDTGDTFTTLPQLVINANAVCVVYDISASTKTFNVKASVNYHFSN